MSCVVEVVREVLVLGHDGSPPPSCSLSPIISPAAATVAPLRSRVYPHRISCFRCQGREATRSLMVAIEMCQRASPPAGVNAGPSASRAGAPSRQGTGAAGGSAGRAGSAEAEVRTSVSCFSRGNRKNCSCPRPPARPPARPRVCRVGAVWVRSART